MILFIYDKIRVLIFMYDLGTQFHFNMQEAKSNPASIVKGNNYRITVLSERLVRIEYSPNGMFIDYPTQLVLCRNFSVPKFECIQDDKYLEISTKYFKLSYSKNMPITESSLRITLNNTDLMWYYGHPDSDRKAPGSPCPALFSHPLPCRDHHRCPLPLSQRPRHVPDI